MGVSQWGEVSWWWWGVLHDNENDNDDDDTYMTPLGRFDLQSRSAQQGNFKCRVRQRGQEISCVEDPQCREEQQNFDLSPELCEGNRKSVVWKISCAAISMEGFLAYSHQIKIPLCTVVQMSIHQPICLSIRPPPTFFWFPDELGDEVKFRCERLLREQCIDSIG